MLSLLIALATPAFADADDSPRDVGLGVAVGSPTGITLKVFTDPEHAAAFDLLVGETWHNGWNQYGLMVSADYLITLARLDRNDPPVLSLYGGPGVNVWFEAYGTGPSNGYGYGFLAAELPIGLSIMVEPTPIELYGEVTPMLVVLDHLGFAMGGSVGARIYF